MVWHIRDPRHTRSAAAGYALPVFVGLTQPCWVCSSVWKHHCWGWMSHDSEGATHQHADSTDGHWFYLLCLFNCSLSLRGVFNTYFRFVVLAWVWLKWIVKSLQCNPESKSKRNRETTSGFHLTQSRSSMLKGKTNIANKLWKNQKQTRWQYI